MWYELEIEPRDVLFFRGGRPMRGDSIGESDGWPVPMAFHEALLTALHEKWPIRQPWEREHAHRRSSHDQNFDTSSLRFGGLKTVGVWPADALGVFFPAPRDIGPNGATVAQPCRLAGKSNLPPPLRYGVGAGAPPEKTKTAAWLRADQYARYLAGETFEATLETDLFEPEVRPGIRIDPLTHATEESKFYMARYLRLRPGTRLRAFAAYHTSVRRDGQASPLDLMFAEQRAPLVYGGQRGVTYLTGKRTGDPGLPACPDAAEPKDGEYRIKWALLTPACFAGGWLPNWVDPQSGAVLLRDGECPPRDEFQTRLAWREAIRALPGVAAKLVAACIGKPQAHSGWRLRDETAKPTVRLVPAGSVYYFEAQDAHAAAALVRLLSGLRFRSDRFGEKGLGLGVCGTWSLVDHI